MNKCIHNIEQEECSQCDPLTERALMIDLIQAIKSLTASIERGVDVIEHVNGRIDELDFNDDR